MPDKEDRQPHATFAKNRKFVEKYSDPKTLAEHIAHHTESYARSAPAITQGLNTAVMNGQQFLQSKLPQPTTSLPLSKEHQPSRTAMTKFNNYYETVNDPISVLKHVKEGTLRHEHLEVLQSIYPKLYDEMKKKVTEHMNPEKSQNLPYKTKLAIGKFMGQPMDHSMLPQSIMSNQAALSGPLLGSQSAMGGKSTLGGLKELNLSTRAATETQKSGEDEDGQIK